MQNWIYFVLIAQGIWSITSLIDKIVISKGYIKNPLVYIVFNGLMNVFLIFLLPFVDFELLKFTDFLIASLSGAVFSISVAVYYKAVEYEDISKIIMLSQLMPIFVLVLSFLFLGEILTRNHLLGFAFLLTAGAIVSYRKTENFGLGKAFYLMLISAFLAAVSSVSAKHIYNAAGFWSAFIWIRLASFSALFVLFVPSIKNQFYETFRRMKIKITGLLIFKMIIDFSAFIFAGYALLSGAVSLVIVLASSLTPLFIFILTLFTSIYFPKIISEDINKKSIITKLLAIILIITGIIFVSI